MAKNYEYYFFNLAPASISILKSLKRILIFGRIEMSRITKWVVVIKLKTFIKKFYLSLKKLLNVKWMKWNKFLVSKLFFFCEIFLEEFLRSSISSVNILLNLRLIHFARILTSRKSSHLSPLELPMKPGVHNSNLMAGQKR